MTLLRKAGLLAGAAVLMSGASASAAFASNPITVSQSGGVVTIDDPTGVGQFEQLTGGGSTYGNYIDIQEINSADDLQAGSGILISINYSSKHWVVTSSDGSTITKVVWTGKAGVDALDASGLLIPVNAQGGDGNDFITGTPQNDAINGGNGNDTIHAGAGNDTLTGFNGTDKVYAEDGDDTIYEHDGYADTLDGGNGTDQATIDSTDTLTGIESII